MPATQHSLNGGSISLTTLGTSNQAAPILSSPPADDPKPTEIAKITNSAFISATRPSDTTTHASEIWKEVLKDHLSKLSEADRKLCDPVPCHVKVDQRTLDGMFAKLRPKYEAGLFHRFLDKVNSITEHVMSFGRAVDVAVGGGDLVAGLVWGGIRILLSVSTRTMSLHSQILDQLELLSRYLPLFERWLKLFHPQDYPELASCIKSTCVEFFSHLVDCIRFFRKSAFKNMMKVFFNPKFESRFIACKTKIAQHTEHLNVQLSTANFEESQRRDSATVKRDNKLLAIVQAATGNQYAATKVTFPFRFVQAAPRNDQFFGREDILIQLDSLLSPSLNSQTGRMRSVVIHGLGGTGKSSVAKEYMYREYHAGEFEVILWLFADTKDKLDTQFIILARHLGIKAAEPEARHAVLSWIDNLDKDFLMVFDNADDPSFLKNFWPHTVRGSVLVTSRNPKTKEEGFASADLQLKAFDQSEGAKFLMAMLPAGFCRDDDEKAVQILSETFGGLPLPLKQAGSFMRNKNCNPAKFSKIYEQKHEDIQGYQVDGYDRSVATTWTISTSTLSEDSRVLLDALSMLDPDSIATEIFDVTDFSLPNSQFLNNPLTVLDAQEGLTKQSLVDYDHHSRSFSIHRYLHHITFSRLRKDHHRFQRTIAIVLGLMHKYVPAITFTAVRNTHNWKFVEKTLSHIQCIHGRCKDTYTEHTSSTMLVCMTKVLCYAYESAQYQLGDWAYAQAEALTKKISDPDHEVLSLLNLLFSRLCGEMSRAQRGLDASLAAEKHIMIAAKTKPELLRTGQYLRILTNIGIMNTALENWDEALKWHNKACDTCIELGMQEESSLGNLRQNLAGTYLWRGDETKGDLEKAEEVVRQSLTEPNQNPMGAMYTLGNVLLKQGRLDEAVEMHRKTKDAYTKSLGSTHPVVAGGWRKLGSLYEMPEYSGYDLEEAERCYRNAYRIWSAAAIRQNEETDRCVATAQWWLGTVLEKIGSHHSSESQELKKAAMVFLNDRFSGSIPGGKTTTEIFEGIMFYWSR